MLVGTVSVEVSEMLSRLLDRHGVPHNVLNAKQHEREAEIIMNAGQKGSVTIATNMAGRGVDIKLGEAERETGGLYVLGHRAPREPTHRQPASRAHPVARATRGRRRFYLSAEDELIRLFAGDRMYRVLSRLGPEEGEPIEAKMLSNVVEKAQVKVEELNFMRRKNVLKYDEVMNEQRRVVYDQRQRILMGEDFGEQVREMVAELVEETVRARLEDVQYAEDWDLDALFIGPQADLRSDASRRARSTSSPRSSKTSSISLVDDALAQYEERERLIGTEQMRVVERAVMLQVIDSRWKDHLLDMDYLQEGIHLRALGQRDPLVAYKGEGFELFQDMMNSIKTSTVTTLMKNSAEDLAVFTSVTLDEPLVRVNYTSGDDLITQTSFSGAARAAGEFDVPDEGLTDAPPRNLAASGGRAAASAGQAAGGVAVQQRVTEEKVGRNDPCPCGSGKKYKRCHGA